MEFVSYELSKKLKEKGFSQRPYSFNYNSYYEWDGLRKIHSLSNASVWFDPNISRDNIYFAPTISQVLKWLREKKKIYLELVIVVDAEYMCDIYKIDAKPITCLGSTGYLKTYEAAALAGIEYVLDNLI